MVKKMMNVLIIVTFACAAVFMLASCAKKQIGMEQAVTPSQAAPPASPGKMAPEAVKQPAGKPGLENEIRAFESEHIYFDFDKSELKPEARAILTKKAEWLRANPTFKIRIEGNCDERGTNEYNLALGERRADAAWKFINALGISGDRMTTVSYGEEKPAVQGHDEKAWSKNRRDEFKLIK